MKQITLALAALLWLLALTALADTKAVISGPSQSAAGDMVILDAGGSLDAQAFTWRLADSEKTFFVFDGGTKVIFATGTPGRYVFLLAVGGVVDGSPQVDVAQHVLTIGNPPPTPTPGPLPVPTPTPTPIPIPIPVPTPTPAPAADLQAAVAGIRTAATRNPANAAVAGRAFADFATVLERSPTKLTSQGQFRAALRSFEETAFLNTPIAGTLGLSAPLNSALVAIFGAADGPLDHARAVAFVRAIAWALGG